MATTECTPSDTDHVADAEEMARPERFELPTTWFEAWYYNEATALFLR